MKDAEAVMARRGITHMMLRTKRDCSWLVRFYRDHEYVVIGCQSVPLKRREYGKRVDVPCMRDVLLKDLFGEISIAEDDGLGGVS